MEQSRLARRAARLSATLPAPHFPSEFGSDVILFDSGFASPQVLPDLSRLAVEALTRHREETLQYAPGHGHPELRRWIAGYMNDDGCRVAPEEVLIVNGAKNGLDLICRLFLDEGDAIVVTAPMYFTAIPIFASYGVEFIEVGQDEHGLKVAELEEALARRAREGKAPPKLVYNVTDFHNPSGLTMPLERRQALVELAQRHGIHLVEDNPYRRVRFEGESVPTLKALDRQGLVLHVGTFSKLIAPGLRIGWIAARKDLIARLIQLKADGGTNPVMQRIVLEFCRSEAFQEHTRKVQTIYREHRDRMLEALRRELPEVKVIAPAGGYYVWLTFPPEVDGTELAQRAAQAGVHVIPGSRFFAGTNKAAGHDPGRNHMRLSYSYATPAQIDEGVRRLGQVYRSRPTQ